MEKIVMADLNHWEKNINIYTMIKTIISNKSFRLLYCKRKCEKYRNRNKILSVFFKIIYRHFQVKYGIEIPSITKIGKQFKIGHMNGIVINENVIIGNNVCIQNGVLIGAEFRGKREGTPIIGNKVWVGANSSIVGKIKIGNNVLIAPNTLVNFDVEDNSIVVGNPAKIIKNENATYKYLGESL